MDPSDPVIPASFGRVVVSSLEALSVATKSTYIIVIEDEVDKVAEYNDQGYMHRLAFFEAQAPMVIIPVLELVVTPRSNFCAVEILKARRWTNEIKETGNMYMVC